MGLWLLLLMPVGTVAPAATFTSEFFEAFRKMSPQEKEEFGKSLERMREAQRAREQEQGHTLLHFAAEDGDVDKIKALLAQGADPNVRGQNGSTPLLEAASNKQLAAAQVLLDAGANPNIGADSGIMPIHVPATTGRFSIVVALLKGGADVEARWDGSTPLHLAAEWKPVLWKEPLTLRALLEAGAKPNVTNKDGWTPLLLAVRSGYTGAVMALLQFGADPNIKHEEGGAAALHVAAINGYAEIVEALLLSEKIEVNGKDRERRTPLHYAASHGQIAAIETLNLYGFGRLDVDAEDANGSTPLHVAARMGDPGGISALIEIGANVHAKAGNIGSTPLHEAARHHQTAAIDTLLSAGANVNATSEAGTPLIVAAVAGDPASVTALLRAGADPTIVVHGWTPRQYAQAAKNKTEGDVRPYFEVIKILTEMERKIAESLNPRNKATRRPNKKSPNYTY